MIKKTGVRCAICSRELSNPLSIVRGIGPICIKKITTEEGKIEVQKITRELGLPCNLYQKCRFCPYNIYRTCPRERMALQKDMKNGRAKVCAYCGASLKNGTFTYKSGNKRLYECYECHGKNKAWRTS